MQFIFAKEILRKNGIRFPDRFYLFYQGHGFPQTPEALLGTILNSSRDQLLE